MIQPVGQSLFPGKERVEGPEIKFRAVCALGLAIREHFAELRSICADLDPSLGAFHWIDEAERIGIGEFAARDAGSWPQSVSSALSYLAARPEVRSLPGLPAFFNVLASEVTAPRALDPDSQLSELNSRGFQLAAQLINDPDWSTGLASGRWKRTAPAICGFFEDTAGNFQPATVRAEDRIELRVNTRKFEAKDSLLFYLTLEFQMMHEYVSHFLPVWNSGNALEEEFLLAMMFLYYRERGPRNGFVSLADEADERRADRHRVRRSSSRTNLLQGRNRS